MGATLNIKETELLAVLGPEPIWGQTVYGVTVEAEADYFTDDRGDLSIVGVRDEAECDAIAAMYYATLTELSPLSWQAKVNAQVRVDKRSESTYKTQFRKRQLQFTLPEVLTEDMALERVYMARAIMSMSWRLLEKDMHARWAYAFAQQVSMALTNPALISAAVMARSTMSARDFKTEEECLQTAYSHGKSTSSVITSLTATWWPLCCPAGTGVTTSHSLTCTTRTWIPRFRSRRHRSCSPP